MKKLKDIMNGVDTTDTINPTEEQIAMPDETVATVAPIEHIPATEVLVAAETKELAVPRKKTPLELLADEKLKIIQQLNPDFALDFMNVFTRMKINTKGQFLYSLAGEDFILSDEINVKLLAGDYMNQYWGEKGTPEEGTLVCYSKDGQVHSIDGVACAECPYNREKCSIRFAVALNVLKEGEDPDEIYNINMPQTGAFAFVDYVKLISKKYHKGVKDVVTRMYTVEKDGKDKGQKFNAILFKAAQ